MLKTGKIICPACGGEVVASDSLDFVLYPSTAIFSMIGECDHCGKHYQWQEEYILAGYRDLEQADDESEDEPDDLECGFDPYLGCYTDDC